MHPDLDKYINEYDITSSTNRRALSKFLQMSVGREIYDSITGDTHDDKVNNIYLYLLDKDKTVLPIVKKPLNIVIADDTSSLEYVSYLNLFYNVTVHKSKEVLDPRDIDLVLFTGGEDVDPKLYNEKVGSRTHINVKRDSKEYEVFARFAGYSFLLGICRGSQLLTILNEGRLIQHVGGHCKDHTIIVNKSQRYNMTSSHHQMLYPFDLNEDRYELIAYSEFFQSDTYLNGKDEEIKLPKNFLEPEIVFYNKYNSLCIQGHPEWNHCDPRTKNMCLNLIDKYLTEFNTVKHSKFRNVNDGMGIYSKKYGTVSQPLKVDFINNIAYSSNTIEVTEKLEMNDEDELEEILNEYEEEDYTDSF
jgi:hypothetical protein